MTYKDRTFCASKCGTTTCFRHPSTIPSDNDQLVSWLYFKDSCVDYTPIKDGGYVVRIGHRGKRKYLGYYQDFDEAINVRKAAETTYDYHENHGNIN